jgi:hypothetical protein
MAWLPRLLFRLTLGLAVLLGLVVLLAPLLAGDEGQPDGWARVPALFARDATLRRTAVASAVGLAVTAWIFFRPAGRVLPLPRRVRKAPRTPPGGAGA